MNTTLYEHLYAYGLHKPGQVAQRLAAISEAELSQFLALYVRQAKERELALPTEMGNTDIFPDRWDTSIPLEVVKQLAIYANRIYLHDPLLELAVNWQSRDFDVSSILRHGSRSAMRSDHRTQLAHAIEHMLLLQPLAKAQIIHFAPTFLLQEHRDPRDVYLDSFYGSQGSAEKLLGQEKPFELPPSFTTYIRDHFHVVPALLKNGNPVVLSSETLTPRRTIALYFDGDPASRIQLLGDVHLSEQEGEFITHFPRTEQVPAPEEATFWNWVEGTRRLVITERLTQLYDDIELTTQIGAQFLTSLPASRDLARLGMSGAWGGGSDVLTALLKMELPCFDRATFSSIAKARQNEVAFEDFRSALNQAFREINKLTSPEEVSRRIDEIHRDLLRLPIATVNQQMDRLRHNLFPEAVMLVGSLAATIVMQGSTLGAGALFLGSLLYGGTEWLKARQARQEKREQLQQLPSFFYWELTQPIKPKRDKAFF